MGMPSDRAKSLEVPSGDDAQRAALAPGQMVRDRADGPVAARRDHQTRRSVGGARERRESVKFVDVEALGDTQADVSHCREGWVEAAAAAGVRAGDQDDVGCEPELLEVRGGNGGVPGAACQ